MQQLADDFAGSGLKRSKAGVRHALKHEAVASLASDPRLLNIAQAILGSDAAPFRATLFDKSPEANWLVVWHQDTALPLQERRDVRGWGPWSMKEGIIYAHAPAAALCHVLALRVHLEDSSSHNGPLRILPGTHSKGVLSDADIEQLAIRIAPVECLVPQGGVIAMRPLVVHASSKSQSEAPRRVLHIEYAASKILADGLELAIG
ncbi:MAG: phytanoyl-CoA dioxygenase family protein [Terriglobales bacterium]